MGQVTFTEYFHLLLTGRGADGRAALLPRPRARRARRARDDADERGRADDARGGPGRVAGSGCGRDPRRGHGRARDLRRVRGASRAMQAQVARGRAPAEAADCRGRERCEQQAGRCPGSAIPCTSRLDPRAESDLRARRRARRERAAHRDRASAPASRGRTPGESPSRSTSPWRSPPSCSISGFPPSSVRAVPILARTASLLAHLAEEEENPLGFLMASKADAAIEYRPPTE